MSDEQISLLERYILEQDKEKFFATLVKNSETYVNMRLIDQINRYGLDLPQDVKTELQTFLGEKRSERTLIQFKHRLLELQTEQDPAKRTQLIKEFNEKYLSVSFHHSRPANIKQSDQLKSKTEPVYPTTFDEADLGFEAAVTQYYNQTAWDKIKTIRPNYYHLLDMKRLLDKSVYALEHVLNTLTNFAHIKDITKLMKAYYTDKVKTAKGFQIPINYYLKMTLEQLEALKADVPTTAVDKNYLSTWFQKTFETELNIIPLAEDLKYEEYRDLLVRILAWAKNIVPKNKSVNSFSSQILREILQLDLENNTYNKELFIEYLENPNNILGIFEKNYQITLSNTKTGYDSHWHSIHNIKVGNWMDEGKIVEEYLLHFFKTMTNQGEFEQYFCPTQLAKIFYTAKILNGENVDNITKIFTEKELNDLRESKKLKFVSWNKDKFEMGDKIKLFLEVKNIQNFAVNIFEINTESYYRKNKSDINEKINLTGLIPSKTIEKTNTNAPIISQVIEFDDLFEPKRGVYIVEFIGGGLYSRALIRIGALSLIRQVLSKGLLFHMIDEQKRICSGEGTHIFVGDKIFKTDQSLDHGILIPYTEKDINEVGILSHGGFSELTNLNIPSERVTFEMGVLFNEESLISGNTVSFILNPKVFVNGNSVSISTVKKLKAEIISTNDVGINNTNTFEDIKVEVGKDIIVNYLIPPKTERVSIKLSGKFFSSAQEKEISLENTSSLTINRFRDRYVFYNFYLSQNGSKYVLHFLGKNGEPYANQKVNVNFVPLYLTNTKSVAFETDSQGEVQLGQLSNVTSINVSMIDSPCNEKMSANYSLANNDKINTLPRSFDIVQGEDIRLPVHGAEFNSREYELSKICKNNYSSVIADLSASLTCENSCVYLNQLAEGLYRFTYRELQVSIIINVHKGKRWEASPEFLVKDKSIIKLVNQSLYIAYNNFKVEGKKVSFNVLSNNMKTVQVHAFAYSYFPTTFNSIFQSVKQFKVSDGTESFQLGQNSNVYLSQKGLSDEIKYVLERKRKNTFMGNTLDKPSSLLKRHFVRETQQDQEQLKGERDFEASKKKLAKSRQTISLPVVRRAGGAVYNIDNLNTFLGKEGWGAYNVLPDENGLVSFELPDAECYGTLLLIIKDSKNSIIETRPLESKGKEITPITLTESKKANKVYLYDRIAHKISKGEECQIKDLAATELSLVEDVQTLFKMLKLISSNSSLDEWDFLAKWSTMSPEEQLKKYDKYISHEFNLFAYFKDREFFTDVVKPHLSNKSNKSLIDFFLLDDAQSLKKYLNPVTLNTLNVLEVSLITLYFSKTQTAECQAIAAKLKQKVSCVYHDIKEFKRLFDSVLKAQENNEANPMPIGGNNLLMGRVSNFSNVAPMMQQMNQPMTQTTVLRSSQPMMQQQYMPSSRMSNTFSNRAPVQMMQQQYAPVALSADQDLGLEQQMAYYDDNAYEERLESNAYGGGYGGYSAAIQPITVERYRTLGVTNEYIERQYFEGGSQYISEGKFWVDFIAHSTSGTSRPFLSENFIYSTSSLTEMLLVLALVDLPFEKGTHTSDSANNQLKLVAGSNCIVFSKEIQEKGDQKLDLDILISQKFYDPFDRYVHSSDGSSKMLKNVKEFMVGKLYMSRVAITNSSETQHEINVVTEIPQGSIPVISLEYMKSTNMNIEPLSTQVIEFFFYFPSEGEFTCYPASINKDGCLVTTATGVESLKVVRVRKATEMKTISDILSLGSKSDILNFMDKENIHNTDIFQFNNIYWLLDDPEFYKEVLQLLRKKFIYDSTVWSFSIKHGDFETFVEYLNRVYKDTSVNLKAGEEALYVSSKIITIDKFTFKEYNPLINPRVHDIGEYKHNILNRDFKATYHEFLKYLFQKTTPTSKDFTYFCTYLILQDRIDDSLAVYHSIKPEEISPDMKIQYDYLTAYLDLYNDYPKFTKAREICTVYLTYPIFTWRNRFIDLLNQIAEFDGETELLEKQTEETDNDKNQRQSKKEEYIASQLEGKSIKVTTKNLSSFTVKFYKIDLEIMYSQDPFLSVDKNDYSFVTPNHVTEKAIGLSAEYSTDLVAIPDHLVSSNLIVQISAGALSENLTYFPTSMKVFIIKNYGQIKISSEETGKPLTNVYIKCFSKKTNGQVSFYKDGYTDLRGTFEYTSVQGSDFSDVSEFSILVFSEKHGALIRQTKPPTTVSKIEVHANKVISAKMHTMQESLKNRASKKYVL